MWEHIVQAGGYRSEAFYIFFVVQRVKNKVIVELLEQSKISCSSIGSSKDIILLHVFLVGCELTVQIAVKRVMGNFIVPYSF